jgi:hypothetical protein
MPDWGWEEGTNRYRDLETGRFVSAAQVREWGAMAAEASGDLVAELSVMVVEGQLNVADWTLLMRDEIKDAYIQQYVFGRGGLDQMTQVDWGRIGGMLREQYLYLNRFAAEIATGKLTAAQVAHRARMYSRSAREAYGRALENAQGMPRLPDYPGAGNTICLTNCMCQWEIEKEVVDGKTRWLAYWRLNPAEHCSSPLTDAQGRPMGCVQRAALWNPLVLEA